MHGNVIVGGGYAGVMAANRLAGRREPVTLITAEPEFVERIRLHAVASGSRDSARVAYDRVLHPAVTLTVDRAVYIDTTGSAVHLDSGGSVPYDFLVYAVGSGSPKVPPGDYSVAIEASAIQLRETLAARPANDVVIVGAGLTGVELACSLALAGHAVHVVTRSPMAGIAERAHRTRLESIGVTVRVDAEFDRTARPGAIVVHTTGFSTPSLARDSGLATDAKGRLLVDSALRSVDHPRVVGAGDGVAVVGAAGRHLRASCAMALPMGAHAADVVSATLDGRTVPEFSAGYLLRCVDLGAGVGRIQFTSPADEDRPLALAGRAGGGVKELVCRMTLTWLDKERRRPGSYSWPAGPRAARTEAPGTLVS